MRVKPLVATIIAVALMSCHSQRATLESVQIVEFGRFQKNMSQGSRLAPDAVAGKSSVVVAATLLESTTDIPATAGTSFGVRVKFVGAPAGLVVPCTAKCLHPKLTDPASGRSSKIEQWENFGTLGGDGYIGYSFDNEWELVPGQWTIQILVGSKVMAEKTFNVFATPAPNPAT